MKNKIVNFATKTVNFVLSVLLGGLFVCVVLSGKFFDFVDSLFSRRNNYNEW